MILLGYKYNETKKCYCTDGRERPDVVTDRNDRFLIEYFRLEKCAHRWVQLDEAKAVRLEKELANFPLNCYCAYTNADNDKMREYHVDNHDILSKYISGVCIELGGNLSVRLNGRRPVLLVGQDESTFHQYTFSKKSWKGPNGSSF